MTVEMPWEAVLQVDADTLATGDRFIAPAVGVGYRAHADGTVRGVGWLPLEGTEWAVTGRDGDAVTARNAAGRERSQRIPTGAKILKVTR